MLRIWKKGITFIMILAMIMVVASGCSRTGKDNDTKDPVGTADSNGTDNQTPEPAYDFGGREITFVSWFDLVPKTDTLQGELRAKRISELEKKYNMKIKFRQEVGGNEFYELLTASLLAGDPLGDIMPVQVQRYPALAFRNMLYPVSELTHIFDWSDPKWSAQMHDAATINGKFYAFHSGYPQVGFMMFFNKSIFEKMNLPDIYELQRNNQWTWEKMLEIAKQAHTVNQDGTVEIWGMTGLLDLYGWVYSNDGNVMRVENGKPKFALNEPKALRALQFAQDIIHKDRIYALTPAGNPWDWPVGLFKEGKAAMMFGEQWLWQRLQDMTDDFGVALPPKGPDAADNISLTRVSTYWAFPAGIKNVDEVAMVVNALTEPYPDFPDKIVDIYGSIGWEGTVENWARDAGTMESNKLLREGRQRVDFYEAYPEFAAGHWNIQGPIRNGANTAAAVIEEFANIAQSWFDDAFVD